MSALKYLEGIDNSFCRMCRHFKPISKSEGICLFHNVKTNEYNWCEQFTPFKILAIAESEQETVGLLMDKNSINHLFEIGFYTDYSGTRVTALRNKIQKIGSIFYAKQPYSGKDVLGMARSGIQRMPDEIVTKSGSVVVKAAKLFLNRK